MAGEFLLLAHTFDEQNIGGWFWSEKLDGMRAFWDGGLTTGLPASEVPWANTDKDSRLLATPISTGLWSRYGHVIYAPDWWLKHLPRVFLDGELWTGRRQWEKLISIVKKHEPTPEWRQVIFKVFDIPSWQKFFLPRKINTINYKKVFTPEFSEWAQKRSETLDFEIMTAPISWTFQTIVNYVNPLKDENLEAVKQTRLPFRQADALTQLQELASEYQELGAEGLVLRRPASIWTPERSWNLLKAKPWHDAEGTVIGYNAAKTGKIFGKMGSLILRLENDKQLMLSGFTDEERCFGSPKEEAWACEHPGEIMPSWCNHPTFPRGTRVTYKYRELSKDGIPKDARYLRKEVIL